ncbi:hypothetical protein H4R19_005615 [Coemansia spiralis]|nr:hypothetical protein H4R19_005615 [Coemansia spiralis]
MSRPIEQLTASRSPLAGAEQRVLREWIAAWEFSVHEFSGIAQPLVRGDIGALRREHARLVEEHGTAHALQTYQELRETRIQMPAMETVIAGAQYFVGRRAESEIVARNHQQAVDHAECLRFLCSIGVHVDAEDVAGFTAFMRASQTRHSRIDLAKVLLDMGANVNHRSRFGGIALHEAIMAQDRVAVAFLSRSGADMDIQDNDGVSPRHIVSLVL